MNNLDMGGSQRVRVQRGCAFSLFLFVCSALLRFVVVCPTFVRLCSCRRHHSAWFSFGHLGLRTAHYNDITTNMVRRLGLFSVAAAPLLPLFFPFLCNRVHDISL
jgi:hypothetical protein